MKTSLKLLLILFIFFGGKYAAAQDTRQADLLFSEKKYKEAAAGYEKALPLIKQQYGEKDTAVYGNTLLKTAISFDKAFNFSEAEPYYLKCKTVYQKPDSPQNLKYAEIATVWADCTTRQANTKIRTALS